MTLKLEGTVFLFSSLPPPRKIASGQVNSVRVWRVVGTQQIPKECRSVFAAPMTMPGWNQGAQAKVKQAKGRDVEPLGGTLIATGARPGRNREFVSSLAGAPPSLPFCLHASFHRLLIGCVALEEGSNAPLQVTPN